MADFCFANVDMVTRFATEPVERVKGRGLNTEARVQMQLHTVGMHEELQPRITSGVSLVHQVSASQNRVATGLYKRPRLGSGVPRYSAQILARRLHRDDAGAQQMRTEIALLH
ncbi:Hypothetical protein SMAX5B_007734 [Scophthalmus maximus]|uniref:Uncharacterized protein n=1 Tax=Scophthalmus maximus TaxID=52904 RepID=A0A2U9B2E5_SCOMX|nr:Hypothetical protein SMAX5B_007734 [Scophthalmus maximus]